MSGEKPVSRRRVRLFKYGRNQAIRIPREFELPGDEVILTKEGNRLILEPTVPVSLLAVLDALDPRRPSWAPIVPALLLDRS